MLKKKLSNYEEELKIERNKYVNITYPKQLFIFHWSVCLSVIITNRSSLLKEEMKVLKEKEDKETKALENLVQKVEKNLETATVSTI